MSALVSRLAALGDLNVDELRDELATLDRARAALAALIIGLETHDDEDPRPVVPSLAGIAEAAHRAGHQRQSADKVALSADGVTAFGEAAAAAARGERLVIVPAERPVTLEEAAAAIDEADAVRDAEEDPPAPSPAEQPPAPAPDSSHPAPAPADSTSDSSTAVGAAERAERIARVFEANRGQWMSRADVLARLAHPEPGPSAFKRAIAVLETAGRLEVKGNGGGRRYRAPNLPDSDPPEEPVNAPEGHIPTPAEVHAQPGLAHARKRGLEALEHGQPAPDPCGLCGFTDCPGHGPHANGIAATAAPSPIPPPAQPHSPSALIGERPTEDAEAVPAHQPAPNKSGRLRRQEAAEARERERRLSIAAEAGPSTGVGSGPRLAPGGKADRAAATLEGRALTALAYRPDTLRGLATRLEVRTGPELEELARALSRLVDDGELERRGRANEPGTVPVYRAAGALSPVG